MSVVGSDNFNSATADADIAGRTPNVGGAWTSCSGLTNTFYASDAGRIRQGTSGTGRRAYYINSSPASAEYDVQADVYVITNSGSQVIGITGRLTSAGDGGYYARYVNASGEWTLFRITSVSGDTSLGTYSATPSTSTAYTLKLEIRDAAKKLYIDGVERISSADNTVTAAGFGGVYGHNSGAGSNSAGHHVDNFSINDLASVGTLSVTLGTTTITATATATGSAAVGSLSVILGTTEISATATFVGAPAIGSLDVTLANTTISASATSVVPAGASGTLSATLANTTISATATFVAAAAYEGPTWFVVSVASPDIDPALSQVTSGDVDPAYSQVVHA